VYELLRAHHGVVALDAEAVLELLDGRCLGTEPVLVLVLLLRPLRLALQELGPHCLERL
jgi:hypothetical protein